MRKAAVVGTGFISTKYHLPTWLRLKSEVALVAVCDTDSASAAAAAARFNVPAAYSNFEELLEKEQPDFVDICTPPASHAEIAVKALAAGAAVIIEKPLAHNLDDCQKIVDAENKSSGRVEVAHTDLFNPVVVDAHRRIARGDIGEVTGMRLLYVTPRSLYVTRPDHFANRLPGGVIGETGPHVVYLARSVIGPIQDCEIKASKLIPEYTWSPYEDYRVELFGERIHCSAVLTYTLDQGGYLVDIWGSDGLLRLDMQSKFLVRHTRRNTSPWGIGASSARDVAQIVKGVARNATSYLSGRFASPHELTIRSFVKRTIEEKPPIVPAAAGLENCQVMADLVDRIETADGSAGADSSVD